MPHAERKRSGRSRLTALLSLALCLPIGSCEILDPSCLVSEGVLGPLGLILCIFFSGDTEVQPAEGDAQADGAQSAPAAEAATEAAAEPALPAAGDVLIVGGGSGSNKASTKVEFYNPATNKFAATGSLAKGRVGIAALEFAGMSANEILVAGGLTGSASVSKGDTFFHNAGPLGTAETLDLATGKFTTDKNTLNTARALYAATSLDDGTILITGGVDNNGVPLATAELFNLTDGSFTQLTMQSARALHTATLLPSGQVLVVGGIIDNAATTTNTAELYDSTSKTFTATGSMMIGDPASPYTVAAHTATLIEGCSCSADGQVLIAGGFSGAPFVAGGSTLSSSSNTALLFDPSAGTFATLGSAADNNLHDTRMGHTATLLGNGTVLITGGMGGQGLFDRTSKGQPFLSPVASAVLDTAEIFTPAAGTETPATGTFACVGGTTTYSHGTQSATLCASTMTSSRVGHTATLIAGCNCSADGEVLIAGGGGGATLSHATSTQETRITAKPKALNTAELFDPVHNTFTATGKMTTQHAFHSAALLCSTPPCQ
jgi:hypothetical protein